MVSIPDCSPDRAPKRPYTGTDPPPKRARGESGRPVRPPERLFPKAGKFGPKLPPVPTQPLTFGPSLDLRCRPTALIPEGWGAEMAHGRTPGHPVRVRGSRVARRGRAWGSRTDPFVPDWENIPQPGDAAALAAWRPYADDVAKGERVLRILPHGDDADKFWWRPVRFLGTSDGTGVLWVWVKYLAGRHDWIQDRMAVKDSRPQPWNDPTAWMTNTMDVPMEASILKSLNLSGPCGKYFPQLRGFRIMRHARCVRTSMEYAAYGNLHNFRRYFVNGIVRDYRYMSPAPPDGGDLFPTQFVFHFFMELSRACIAMNNLGIIHRDINPFNVYLMEDAESKYGFRAVLGDFGAAVIEDDPRFANPQHFVAITVYDMISCDTRTPPQGHWGGLPEGHLAHQVTCERVLEPAGLWSNSAQAHHYRHVAIALVTCLNEYPGNRPTSTKLHQVLHDWVLNPRTNEPDDMETEGTAIKLLRYHELWRMGESLQLEETRAKEMELYRRRVILYVQEQRMRADHGEPPLDEPLPEPPASTHSDNSPRSSQGS
ncbi:hypothetical protein EJ06DRAFT_551269 [Trichodelitschia bisporula]|uniref:Protein kinase domain-containing protein n=1 Tax=Trichodelitschia bisporula TaxID=703511 RepID=A0A6G1HN25_9PEZI|nr:hypothetical protein EJ06DRAFT_551269 [Trichodelitschia bisporula]